MDVTDQPASGEQPAGKPSSLGQVLKTARASRNLTLDQVSTELRIEAQQLQALEQDNFAKIGAPVFVKGYLRQYGQLLGLEYRDLLSMYYDQVEHQEVVVQPSRSIKLRDERQITVWIIAGVVLVVLIVSFVVWWLNEMDTPSSAGASIPASVTTERSSELARSGPSARDADVEPVERFRAVDLADASAVPDDEPAAATAAIAGSRTNGPGEAAGRALQLDLSFAQESWTEITDGRGERLFYGLGSPGRSTTVHGEPPISVLLGNADGVDLAVDGTDYPVPRRAREGNLARFTITAPQASD